MCEFKDELKFLDESFDINSEINEISDIMDIPFIINKTLLKKKRKRHDKYDRDNIKRKIQVFFFKFLVSLINKIIL